MGACQSTKKQAKRKYSDLTEFDRGSSVTPEIVSCPQLLAKSRSQRLSQEAIPEDYLMRQAKRNTVSLAKHIPYKPTVNKEHCSKNANKAQSKGVLPNSYMLLYQDIVYVIPRLDSIESSTLLQRRKNSEFRIDVSTPDTARQIGLGKSLKC